VNIEKTKDGWVEIEVSEETESQPAVPNQPLETKDADIVETSLTTKEEPEPRPQAEAEVETPEPEAVPAPALEAKKKERAETRIRQLSAQKRKFEEESRAREEALLKEIESLRQNQYEAQKSTVSTARSAIESRMAQAQTALEKAYNEADAAAISKAVQALSKETVALERILLAEEQIPKEAPKPAPRQAVQRDIPEALQDWVSQNEWFSEGPKQDRRAALLAAQIGDELTKEGFKLDDPGLYEELDRRLQDEMPRLKKKPVVASPSRGAAPTPSGKRPGVVRLSPEEVEVAKFFGMTPQEYAKQKLRQDTGEHGYTPIE
jgi:hypothetical protein